MDRFIDWLWRHGKRSGLPGDHNGGRDAIDQRQEVVKAQLRALEIQTRAGQRPPPRDTVGKD